MIRPHLLLVLLTWLCACGGPRLDPDLEPLATLRPVTDDGWTLTLRHHGGDGPPVLLVHGMGANHYNWDRRADTSPVDELKAAGFDVWVAGLRGDPDTAAPSREVRNRITFDQHAIHDVPALVDAVLDATGEPDLLWVGHSMGGMLLYTTLATRPQVVRAGIAIGSPATFQTPRHNQAAFRRFGFLVAADRGRIPVLPFARAGLLGFRPLVRQLGNPDNLDKANLRGMARDTLVNLPRATALQARRWLKARDLVDMNGEPWLAGASGSSAPLLVLGAVDDRIAPEPDVAWACRILPSCRYIKLGQQTGFSVDYGHIDPVVGKSAPDEVYPLILQFLEQHRTPRTTP